MLQNIRDNSQGWIAKTIIGVIVVLMALTGFDAIIRATHHENVAAKVNGDDISIPELQQAQEMQRRQLQQRLGKDFDASTLDDKLLKDAALKGLIERKLLLQAAQNDKFAFTQQQVDQLILQTPEFLVDGKFNADKFDQALRQNGYTRMQFRQMLEQEMLIGQLRAGIAGSGFVTDNELQAFARLEKQTRDFATLTFKADPAKAKVEDADIKAYYDAHKAEFMSPDQVVIDYIELKKSTFFNQVVAKDEDLQAQYQKEIAGLSEQRDAAHILIEVNAKQTDAQAKAKIEEIKARLAKGEDFAKLAKEQSNDVGSAGNGGDLGYAGRGVYDQAFEDALYGLKAKGDVSEPVRTQYGWHLIKLLGVQAPEVPSFASLKPKLEQDLKSQLVEQRFVDATKQLESSAYEASDLAQPAQELGLKVETSKPFGREGNEGIAANRQVVQAAFSTEVLEDGANSGAIELDPDTVVVLRVKEHHKPQQQTLEEVTASIREVLQHQHAADAAKAQGETLLAGLRDGKTPLAQAQSGQTWKVVEAASRGQDGVDPQLLQEVFRMARPAKAEQPTFAGVTLGNGDYVLIRLNGVSEPSATLSDQEKAMYRQFLASRSGQEDFAAFRRQLSDKAEVEKY
ncbi:peptidyl-prolyl cis-trans isomerase D [Pseudomonas citronellolis]|uniref:SurA N-terminal domain-containing protein n=1 Tax=Pseudomonas citronellolis TaxID=53408 RepID=UPI00209EEF6D|nr:SurA N-terminal domain-containing protein [Pseudomonas citronellolis]MCP1643790.1 peptidyl-prolyl cis-trans isomerase D [Pseudomonas citronellolis]MCP1666715.1 peptidyl-prolyl cis-trans isomerase D [Pseudomonas citronellolis]MCP1697279.1 peptidyl-prolyl cis-trans isomerase D [Pseudomonas citronellolis]MCP1704254.1 peptidyl-prolyl cis-trans isomerase D [Pseudomonas citronellolis]MCP1798405.1 peptidyl-prolyl cis-trans isomerase D [Pseudomonas citronellolis]